MEPKSHWEKIYNDKPTDEVSWYQEHAELSLELINESGVPKEAAIIDVGGGSSALVDDLLNDGYSNLSVLDLSEAALQVAQQRLGDRSDMVTWLTGDITSTPLPVSLYDVWHDRAVFHFLVKEEDRAAYLETLAKSLKPGGTLIMATFAEDGPKLCSGLPVKRYGQAELEREFSPLFALIHCRKEEHRTPTGTVQRFIYCAFKKLPQAADKADKPEQAPELSLFIEALIREQLIERDATLSDVRAELLSSDIIMSPQAELMYPLDRTSLVNLLDNVIERLGEETSVQKLINQ